MDEIFTIHLITEPDFQRLNTSLMKGVESLSEKNYRVAQIIPQLTKEIRQDFFQTENPVKVSLILEQTSLFVKWNSKKKALASISSLPSKEKINFLKNFFNEELSSASPELLRLQNLKIKNRFENAKKEAQKEIKQIEKQLESRKEKLKEYMIKAETDPLTGLFNRRAYTKQINSSLDALRMQNKVFCLLYLDLDHFKIINDTYGHSFGDKVLKSMAMNMTNSIREKTDLAFRIGGDEFAIIIFSNENAALRISKKIMEGIQQGISIGYTKASKKDTPETITKRADMALYFSKDQGRGSITCAFKSPKTEDPSASSLEILFNGKSKASS
ncbi:MAG: GGDEF domain-containing protein [Desulforegulaceae bacterium]|nr:GGDEF domain-containing protein [Desulforegulaceae bacterium]